MDTNVLKGKWLQLKGSAKVKWGKLTNDDLDQVEGNAEKLIGLVQERYGYLKGQAEAEVNDFISRQEAPAAR